MIAKLVKGKGFRGALEYDLREQKGELLDTNMGGNNPRDLAREFGEIRALRPNLTKAVCHVSISVSPEEKLTDEQWKDVTQAYLKGMGFQDSQYVASKHTDTEHPHIHIIANRITMKGEVVSDSKDYQRQEVIMRQLEKEYGLREVQPSRESLRRSPTKGEIECAVHTGRPSEKVTMQGLVDKALQEKTDFETFRKRLEKNGVEIMLNRANTGRVSGISYRHNEITMKGSDLGRGYSWSGIQKRGLTYEQTRSIAAGTRPEHERDIGNTDGESAGIAQPEGKGRGRISGLIETISRSNAELDRDNGQKHVRIRGADEGTQGHLSSEATHSRQFMERGITAYQYITQTITGGAGIMDKSKERNAGSGTVDNGQCEQNQATGERGAVDISDNGKLAGVADIQRLAALANARSQAVHRGSSEDILENRQSGENTDSHSAEREKIAENKKERRRGDDLEL